MKAILRAAVCGVCHRVPLKSGLAGVMKLRPVRWLLDGAGGEAVAVLRNGVPIPVNTADYNGRMLMLFGTPDPKIVAVCRRLTRPGDCLLDIGANHGAVGMLCQDAVGEAGQVHLFEPQPRLCQRIRSALARTRSGRVMLHEVALADKDGVLSFSVPTQHSGAGSLVRHTAGAEEIQVQARAAAAYVRPLLAGRPFGVKLDVEGAEGIILPELLGLDGLRFVTFECNRPEEASALWRLVRDAGLELMGLRRTLLRVVLDRLERSEQMQSYHDLLAVRADASRLRPRMTLRGLQRALAN
jgi:FkbM family methyltransferase